MTSLFLNFWSKKKIILKMKQQNYSKRSFELFSSYYSEGIIIDWRKPLYRILSFSSLPDVVREIFNSPRYQFEFLWKWFITNTEDEIKDRNFLWNFLQWLFHHIFLSCLSKQNEWILKTFARGFLKEF